MLKFYDKGKREYYLVHNTIVDRYWNVDLGDLKEIPPLPDVKLDHDYWGWTTKEGSQNISILNHGELLFEAEDAKHLEASIRMYSLICSP